MPDQGEANNILQRQEVAESEKAALFCAEGECLNQDVGWHWINWPFGF